MKTYSIQVLLVIAGIAAALALLTLEYFFQTKYALCGYVMICIVMIWSLGSYKNVIAVGVVASLLPLRIFLFPVVNSTMDWITFWVLSVVAIGATVFYAVKFRHLYQNARHEKFKLRALFQHAREGIIVATTTGQIIEANPYAEKIFAYHQGELSARNIREIITLRNSDDRDFFDEFLKKPTTTLNGQHFTATRKDETELNVDVSLQQFSDGNKSLIIAFIQDATQRVRNDQLIRMNLQVISEHSQELERKVRQRTRELELANQELIKSQAVYRSMAKSFPDGFIGVMDKDLNYILVDGKGLKELGMDPQSDLGEKTFNSIHEEITTYGEGCLMKVFEGSAISFDTEIVGKYYNVSAVPIEGMDSLVNEILVVVKNVSSQKSLERELVKTLAKEKDLNTLKSRFVTMASHEFRTPLTTILSSAFLLENYRGERLESEKRKHLDRIKRSVHGLTELLNDFLSLDKLEEGMVKVAYKKVYLRQFADELIQEMLLIKKENQRIVFEFEGEESEVMIDRQLVRNILINLLSNAIKYSPASGTIGLFVSVTSNEVQLKVSDQGIGIPAEEQKHIFKRFFRANNTSEIQGTGLGLNIVKRYVKLLKGRIHFHSRVNKGTVFTVTLPLEPALTADSIFNASE